MLVILGEWKHLGRFEGHVVVHLVKCFRIGNEIYTCNLIQSTNKTIINKTKRLRERVLALSSLTSRLYFAAQSVFAKAFPLF